MALVLEARRATVPCCGGPICSFPAFPWSGNDKEGDRFGNRLLRVLQKNLVPGYLLHPNGPEHPGEHGRATLWRSDRSLEPSISSNPSPGTDQPVKLAAALPGAPGMGCILAWPRPIAEPVGLVGG